MASTLKLRVKNTFLEVHDNTVPISRRFSDPLHRRPRAEDCFIVLTLGQSPNVDEELEPDSMVSHHTPAVLTSCTIPIRFVQKEKQQDVQAISGIHETTLMIRNIPNRCSQAMLMDKIDQLGFAGTYDFFYLPIDNKRKSNKGYAFINFMDSATVSIFEQSVHGKKLSKFQSMKLIIIARATLQGYEANLNKFGFLPDNEPRFEPYFLHRSNER